jgi:hypothetical protein
MHESGRRGGTTRPAAFRIEAPPLCAECGGAQWLVGRHVAECAGCAAPVARADGDPIGLPRPRLLRRAA